MIALPELLIVLAVFSLMCGYIALLHYMLGRADEPSRSDSTGEDLGKS